jgi:hypothetical protein
MGDLPYPLNGATARVRARAASVSALRETGTAALTSLRDGRPRQAGSRWRERRRPTLFFAGNHTETKPDECFTFPDGMPIRDTERRRVCAVLNGGTLASTSNLRKHTGVWRGPEHHEDRPTPAALAKNDSLPARTSAAASLASLRGAAKGPSAPDSLTRTLRAPQRRAPLVGAPGGPHLRARRT